jgi:hypothetical protein
MDKLLNFIDHLCLDDQLYWKVPLIVSGAGEAEVRWQRDAKPLPWTVRVGDGAFHKDVRSADLVATLAAAGIDQDNLENQLGASILTQAAFASMVTDGAVAIFGRDVVERSVSDTKDFLQAVSKAASEFAAKPELPPPSSRLRLVRD